MTMTFETSHIPVNHGMYPSPIKVLHLVLQETGTYGDQFRRSYVSNINADNLNGLVNAAAGVGTGLNKLMPQMSMMVVPSNNFSQASYIPHGWNTRRFRFNMNVQITDHMGLVHIETIGGFTEFADASMNGLFDPNMLFVVNSVSRARLGRGREHYIDSNIVIPGVNSVSYDQQNCYFKQRPEDIISGLDNALYNDPSISGAIVHDLRNQLTTSPVAARRSEQVPTLYLGNIVQEVAKSRAIGSINGDDDDTLGSAYAALQNRPIGTIGFMQHLSRHKQLSTNDFTFNELMQIDPGVVNVTQVIPLDNAALGSLHYAGLTAVQSLDIESTIFEIVSRSVMSCMVRTGLYVVRFSMDNMSETVADAKPVTKNLDVSSFGAIIEAFTHIFRTEVFLNVSQNNGIGLILRVDADLNGDITVGVGVNGQEEILYTTPAFCDALTTPLITNDTVSMGQLINDIGTVVDNVSNF